MINTVVKAVETLRTLVKHAILAAFVFAQMSLANADVDLTNFTSTSGAGSKKIDEQTNSWIASMNNGLKFFFAVVTLAGIVMAVASLKSINKAKREDRDAPASATYGLVIGGALTCIPLLIGLLSNTISG